jgi:hypothetical protein
MVRPTEYDQLLDRITVDLSITSVTRFGGRGGAGAGGALMQPAPLSREMHCPPFYSHVQNPDYALFDAIARDTSGGAHLYVTDGVQSDVSGANVSPSVEKLKDWVEGGRALAVLAFRSRFEGRAWSETRKQWLGQVTAERRPFYAFVFAPTEEGMDRLLAGLSDDVRAQATVLRFRRDGATCRAAVGPVAKISEVPALPWVMLPKSTTDRAAGAAQLLAHYDCTVRPDFPLATVAAVVDSVRYGRWNGTDFEFPREVPSGTALTADKGESTGGGSRVPIRGTIGRDGSTRHGFLSVTLGGRPGALRPAVAELSADSDERPEGYDRTYRIGWVVEQLARAQLARQLTPAPVFFTVTYQ